MDASLFACGKSLSEDRLAWLTAYVSILAQTKYIISLPIADMLILTRFAQTPTPDGADQLLPILEVVWYKLLGEERKIGNAVKKSIPKQKNVSKKQFLIKQGVKNNEILRTWDRWRRSPSPPPKPEKKGRPGQSHHFDPRKMEKSYIKFKATELPE